MPTILTSVLAVLNIALWFWAIKDIASSRFITPGYRTIWLLVVLFFPLVGSIVYFQLKKRFVAPPRKFSPVFNR